MTTVKEQMSKVTANVPGAIVGGVAVFYAAKKLISADFDRKIAIYTFLHLSDRLIELFDLKI